MCRHPALCVDNATTGTLTMNSQPDVYDPFAASSASSTRRATTQVATADARAAVRNPLWIIAIGMAVFFAAAVAVAALG